MKLFIVDDDEMFVSVLARSLSRRNIDVDYSFSAEQALQRNDLNEFSHAVIDLKMGDLSGLHLLKQLKQDYPDLTILILTGYASIATAVDAIKMGAIDYLCKPANTDQILNALKISELDAPEIPEVSQQPLSVNRVEWEHIQKVLAEHNYNVSATARTLGMHRRTLQRKLQKRPVNQ